MTQKVGGVIQARMSSRRLPGKVLLSVQGKPLLQYLLERVQRVPSLPECVVATSAEASDQPIAELCARLGVFCHRGPLADVAGRFREVLLARDWDAFVRVNADAPLLDPRLIERGLGIFAAGGRDMVTNVMPRTFPPGQSVEILGRKVFLRAYPLMNAPEDFEHVTKFFYKNPRDFRIENFTAESDFSGVRLTVDTKADMDVFARIVGRMTKPHWDYGWREIIELYRDVAPHEEPN